MGHFFFSVKSQARGVKFRQTSLGAQKSQKMLKIGRLYQIPQGCRTLFDFISFSELSWDAPAKFLDRSNLN